MHLADSKTLSWGIFDAISPLLPSPRQSIVALSMSMLTTISLQKQKANFQATAVI
jgi:hypothetical protein